MGDRAVIAKSLFDMVYQTFETSLFNSARSLSAGNNQCNEVQFRLQQAIASYSKGEKNGDTILTDAKLANAMGWMTDETYQKFESMLGES